MAKWKRTSIPLIVSIQPIKPSNMYKIRVTNIIAKITLLHCMYRVEAIYK